MLASSQPTAGITLTPLDVRGFYRTSVARRELTPHQVAARLCERHGYTATHAAWVVDELEFRGCAPGHRWVREVADVIASLDREGAHA